MKKKRYIIGLTEPSQFTQDCVDTIEKLYDANVVKLCHGNAENTEFWLERCRGVVLAGGVDLHPMVYGQSVTNNNNFSRFDLRRDMREVKIYNYCRKRNIPMLGICRGHQLIGVMNNMRLVQDLSDCATCHQPQRQQINVNRGEPMHTISLNTGENPATADNWKLYDWHLKNTGNVWVNSFHHQGIVYDRNNVPKDIQVLAWAHGHDKQKIVELMTGPNWISAQWHPEFDWEENSMSRWVLDHFQGLLETNVVEKPAANVAPNAGTA